MKNLFLRMTQRLSSLFRHVLSAPLLSALTLAVLVAANVHAAAEKPATVRIATFAYVKNGKVELGSNGYYGRVIGDKWLENELAKKGIKLEWVPVTGDTGPVINEAFTAGRIDFATYGDLPSIILNAAGIRTQVIVPNGRGEDVYLVVPANSTAKTLEDLKGKRISVHRSRPWELAMIKYMASKGLSPKDFRVLNMDTQAGASALASGRVDGFFINAGGASNPFLLEDRKLGRIIWSTKSDPLFKMRAELWGTSNFIRQYPEVTQLVATAFIRAQYWASLPENRETLIREGTLNGTPESVVRRRYDDSVLAWKDRWAPLFDDLAYAQYRNDIAIARSRKLISRDIKAEELLEPRFAKAALQALNLVNYWQPWQPPAVAKNP
jgi:sulfonate transport system substrate-binding protein